MIERGRETIEIDTQQHSTIMYEFVFMAVPLKL